MGPWGQDSGEPLCGRSCMGPWAGLRRAPLRTVLHGALGPWAADTALSPTPVTLSVTKSLRLRTEERSSFSAEDKQ